MTQAPSPPITCTCGAKTIAALARFDSNGVVRSCWIALANDGRARPGCLPDERTADIVARRNVRFDEATSPKPAQPIYPGGTIVRCVCGRTTRAFTSDFSSLTNPPAVADPPDAAVPVGPTSCWLAIEAADGGPQAGCTPDERTWDVLARARGVVPPSRAAALEEACPASAVSESARTALADALAARDRASGQPRTATPPSGPVELSLFE